MDIKAAFDTIKQDKMLEIISDLLDQVRPSTVHKREELNVRTMIIV
jgi:hypothetical protein